MVRDDLRNLKYIFDNSGEIGQKRKEIARYIISVCKDSNNPYDVLAAAVAYQWEGTASRKKAIACYERFIESGARFVYYDKWSLYSSLAELYEAEYRYKEAIRCLYKCQKASNYTNPADFTRIGDIALKFSVDDAIAYYEKLKRSPHYNQHKAFFEAKYATVLEKKRRGYVYRPRNKTVVNAEPLNPEEVSDDVFGDDEFIYNAFTEFGDCDFDDSEWDEFILAHEKPSPRKNVSVIPAAPPAVKKQVTSPEESAPFTGWDDTDFPENKQNSRSEGNINTSMPSCGGCLIGLLLPPVGIYRVWKNGNLSKKNKINATAFLFFWLCIVVLVILLICSLSSDQKKNTDHSQSQTTTTTSSTQQTNPTEPAGSLFERLEIESPLGTTTCLVYDVLNGSKTEVIGQRGYIMMYKETLLNASDEDFVEFIKAVAAPGFNWVTIDFGDGTGIVVRGGITEVIDYGSVIEDSGLDPIYGYAVLRNGKYEYQPKE